MSKRLIVLLVIFAMSSACTAMLVGGGVSSGTAADCEKGRSSEACKK